MAYDPSKIPDALKEAYKEKRCAVLVGAGASMGAGLPSWKKLLEELIDTGVKQQVFDDKKADVYRDLIGDPGKFLTVAAGLKEDLQTYFAEYIEERFIRSKPKPTALHDALVQLDRLQFVLTLNYDQIIERRYRTAFPDDVIPVLSYQDVGELQRRLAKREFFILKAHGDKVGNGLILTEVDYRTILYRQPAYQNLLQSIFTMFTVVFVGASMTDPELKLMMAYIADCFGPSNGPRHYALMAAEDLNVVEQKRWFEDFNVQCVPVSKANNFAEATAFLESLRNCV